MVMNLLRSTQCEEQIALQIDQRIMQLIAKDDRHKFLSFIKSQLGKEESDNSNSNLFLSELLVLTCRYSALKCAAALVGGAIGQTMDLNVPLRGGLFPLHHAALSLSPALIDLFLQNGAQAGLKCNTFGHKCYGLLPLSVALESLSLQIDWTPRQSIFELIFSLCGGAMGEPMKAIKLLAMKTAEVKELSYHFAEEGKLIELAALLMVDRSSINSQSLDEFYLDGSMTFHRYIATRIVSIIDEEHRLMGSKHRELAKICVEKKRVMMSVMLLVEVFQRAGLTMGLLIKMFGYDHFGPGYTAKRIAQHLEGWGFDLTGEDLCLEGSYGTRKEQKSQFTEACSNFYTKAQRIRMPIRVQRTFPVPLLNGLRGIPFVVQSYHTFGSFKARFFHKVMEVQGKKTSKAMEQHVPNFISSKRWTSIALAIKRGIRRI